MDYIEVDVYSGGNCDLDINRIFEPLENPFQVSWVETAFRPDGWEGPCEIIGWSSEGPVAAYAAKVMDSGDGAVVLIFGGDEGIRLRPQNSSDDWSLESKSQWGEPCLMLEPTTRIS